MSSRDHSFSAQSWLDKILVFCRYFYVFQWLKKHKNVRKICDVGCGAGTLVKKLNLLGFDASGLDFEAGDKILSADLNKKLPLGDESQNLVTSLAVLEHLDEPLKNLKEIRRILDKDGVLLLTTPSTAAKPVLEFLAFKLKIIDEHEILDHKQYFSKKMLEGILREAGFEDICVKRFQFGMNLFAIAKK